MIDPDKMRTFRRWVSSKYPFGADFAGEILDEIDSLQAELVTAHETAGEYQDLERVLGATIEAREARIRELEAENELLRKNWFDAEWDF